MRILEKQVSNGKIADALSKWVQKTILCASLYYSNFPVLRIDSLRL